MKWTINLVIISASTITAYSVNWQLRCIATNSDWSDGQSIPSYNIANNIGINRFNSHYCWIADSHTWKFI